MFVSQGVSNELFQRRQSFTVFTEEARKLSEGVMDAGTMHFKAKLCSLRERWNELFEKARMSESNAELGLKPLNEYQEVFVEFTSRFEELEEKLSSQVPFFSSSEEVAVRIEEEKVNKFNFVYVIAWARGQLRINFTRIFKVFTKLPESRSDEGNLENFENASEINP